MTFFFVHPGLTNQRLLSQPLGWARLMDKVLSHTCGNTFFSLSFLFTGPAILNIKEKGIYGWSRVTEKDREEIVIQSSNIEAFIASPFFERCYASNILWQDYDTASSLALLSLRGKFPFISYLCDSWIQPAISFLCVAVWRCRINSYERKEITVQTACFLLFMTHHLTIPWPFIGGET